MSKTTKTNPRPCYLYFVTEDGFGEEGFYDIVGPDEDLIGIIESTRKAIGRNGYRIVEVNVLSSMKAAERKVYSAMARKYEA